MIFSLDSRGIFAFWQFASFLSASVIGMIFLAWFAGVQFRLAGQTPPEFKSRFSKCFCIWLIAIPVFCATVVAAYIVCKSIPATKEFIDTNIGLAVCLIFCVAVACAIMASIGGRQFFVGYFIEGTERRWVFGVSLATLALFASLISAPTSLKYRALIKQSIGVSNLVAIVKSTTIYSMDHNCFPPDLKSLCKEGRMSPKYLYPHTGWVEGDGYDRPSDWNYIYIYSEDAPGDLIMVWDDPKWYENRGSAVLRYCGSGEWLSADKLAKDLARTYQWRLENPIATSQPASRPTSSPTALPTESSIR